MHYDPVKNIFAGFINRSSLLRRLFYHVLNVLFLRAWYVRREIRRIRKMFGGKAGTDANAQFYDAGTGYGQYSYFIAKQLQPAHVYAVDVKEDWIENLKPFFAKTCGKAVELGVEDVTQISHENRFDIITCIDVMEHIEDDVCVFQNYFRALKPGGVFLMNSPSIFGGSDVHDEHEESFIGEHARAGYSYEDLKEKLEPIGFTIDRCVYTYGPFGEIAWRLGIKYPILLVNASKFFIALLPFYYLITFPFTFLLMAIDFFSKNEKGTGIQLTARKPLL